MKTHYTFIFQTFYFRLEPLFRPTKKTPSSTPPPTEISTSLSSLSMTSSSTLLNVNSTREIYSIQFTASTPQPESSTLTVLAPGGPEKKTSETSNNKVHIILACGIVGGIILLMIIAVTIYLKR